MIEAVQRIPGDAPIGAAREAIIARRGKEDRSIAKVAAARRLLTLIYYGLRDGEIRCLAKTPQELAARGPASGSGMNSFSWPVARREAARSSASPPRRRGHYVGWPRLTAP